MTYAQINYVCCECGEPLNRATLFIRKVRHDRLWFCNSFCYEVYKDMVNEIEIENGKSIYAD